MQLLSLASALTLVATASAHSWAECINTEVSNKAAAQADPSLTVEQTCHGYPRNKLWNGDWIAESSNYAYGLSTDYACRDNQRTATYPSSAPMASATPGQELLVRYWGNGHSRMDIGSPIDRNPGVVRIYWTGKKETEITYKKDLTEKYWIPGAQSNFSADAVIEVQSGATSVGGMDEKANWMKFTVPEKIENGRHMMVWAWAWNPSLTDKDGVVHPLTDVNVYDTELDNAWTTCFDIQITGSSFTGTNPDMAAAATKYASTTSESDEVCSLQCFRGGMTSNPCTGANCPPCRYRQMTNGVSQINCYEKTGDKCQWNGATLCDGSSTSSSATYKRDHLNVHKKRHS